MALLAFHTFFKEGTQAAIFETHHGGEYDATNVITGPVVTGITTIGLDHILQLGPTIDDIAWHKAGIFKAGTPAFSAPQEPSVEAVLRSRALDKDIQLEFVNIHPLLPRHARALFAEVQRINCSLAIALVNAFLRRRSPSQDNELSTEDIKYGIEEFSWPGRFETIQIGKCRWFLDGAHNELSIGQAVEWFARALKDTTLSNSHHEPRPFTVIFSHLSEDRDGAGLLKALARALGANQLKPEHMIFTTYQERRDGRTRFDKTLKIPDTAVMELPRQYCDLWKEIHPAANVRYEHSIEEALDYAKALSVGQHGMDILVTGSLHLVGGALHLLREHKEAQGSNDV